MNKHFDIIGGGIGGLTTALCLKKNEFDCTVYESAAEIKPVGAGIILANNAMQVFKGLGLKEKIESAGNKISSLSITDHKLKKLSIVNLLPFEKKYQVKNVAIHRGELQRILSEELGLNKIQLSKRVSGIERREKFEITFQDKTKIESDFLIGADGIKSIVREKIFGEKTIRNSGQVCWRGLCDFKLPEEYQHNTVEAWGSGMRFGFVKISSSVVYWYALVNASEYDRENFDLVNTFKNFHPIVTDIIKQTKKERIIFNDIIDLKPIDNWVSRNVCLIGDAAHATTPNLGQGACQAIEDAYVLSQALQKYSDINKAFDQFQKVRIKKAHYIVNTSWRLGHLSHMKNPISIWLRNAILKLVPDSINSKQLEMIFKLDQVKF